MDVKATAKSSTAALYQKADAEFYAEVKRENGGKLPSDLVDAHGNPRKLTMSPMDRSYREKWKAIAAELRKSKAVPSKPAKAVCIPCAVKAAAAKPRTVGLPSKNMGKPMVVGHLSAPGDHPKNKIADATEDQAAAIRAAHDRALDMMSDAIDRLQKAKSAPDPLVKEYFDIGDISDHSKEKLDTLISNYKSMQSGMRSINYEVEKEEIKAGQPYTVAYVYKLPLVHGVGHLHVCFPAFEYGSDDDRAATIVHEMSHYSVGTEDHAYDWQPAWNTLSQKDKMDNADSYGGFAAGALKP